MNLKRTFTAQSIKTVSLVVGLLCCISIGTAWAAQLAKPTFGPPSGTKFNTILPVNIGAVGAVYYTLDGTTPTVNSTPYKGAIQLKVSATVKAIAVKAGSANSPVASASYTRLNPVAPVDKVSPLSWNFTKGQWETFRKNDTLWITADPVMPLLTIHDEISEGYGVPGEIYWQFRSSYAAKPTRSGDARSFPTAGFKAIQYGRPWELSKDYFKEFFGGDASVNFYDNVNGSTVRKFPFKIRGLNPTAATVKSFVTKQGAPRFATAILKHENGLTQFTPSGDPGFGAPDGWGMAQLDYSSANKSASTAEVWNWQVNVSSGIRIMNEKREAALAYFAFIKKTYPKEWEEPPATYKDPRTKTSVTALEAATITLYNGASVRVTKGSATYASCWQFSPTAAAGKRWNLIKNQNDYLYLVLRQLDAGF